MRRYGKVGQGIFVLAIAAVSQAAWAVDRVVGSGQCNEAGFAAALSAVDASGGGTITFACGGSNTTITFASYKTIANAVVVDGGGHITFDGGNASPFFQVFFSAHATLKRLTFQHGVLGDVHAIENFGALTLDQVHVTANTSAGAPVSSSGTLRVRDSSFTGNTTTADGGAIDNASGTLVVSGSTFSGNHAANGAAIHSTGDLDISNSTFSTNAANSGGGAIHQSVAGNAVVEFATLVGNTASFGAGLYNDGGGASTMTVGKSIVTANATGNCDGVIASSGYNLSDDSGCGSAFTGPGDVINATLPMLALVDNGGPTQTRPPAVGNPAIDHVPLASCDAAYDQRGAARPHAAACDSGAVETGGAVERIFMDGFDL